MIQNQTLKRNISLRKSQSNLKLLTTQGQLVAEAEKLVIAIAESLSIVIAVKPFEIETLRAKRMASISATRRIGLLTRAEAVMTILSDESLATAAITESC